MTSSFNPTEEDLCRGRHSCAYVVLFSDAERHYLPSLLMSRKAAFSVQL